LHNAKERGIKEVVENEHGLKQKKYGIDDRFETELALLAEHILSQTPHDGDFNNETIKCKLGKYSRGGALCIRTFKEPSLLIVAQGAKKITIGQETCHVGRAQMLLLPVALPVEIHALEANQSNPFLTIGLDFNPHRIFALASKIYPRGIHEEQPPGKGFVADADAHIINAANRLLLCLSNSDDAQYIAPIILDEILIRVLRSPIGMRLVQMGFTNTNMRGVIRVISWLGENFARQVKVADLAKMAYMSESVFHRHFKNVTSMTPLQYRKSLRLHEARRLLLSDSVDGAAVSSLIGYASVSQFNRDYSRFFGAPPKRDTVGVVRKLKSLNNSR
jgi:AraC-like DNA-binding protein